MQKSKFLLKKIFKHMVLQPQNNYKINIARGHIGDSEITVSKLYHEKANTIL